MAEPGLQSAESVRAYLRRIWLGRAVGLIYEGHLHHVQVHTPYGERYGRDEAVADTVQELAAFPDLRFRAEGTIGHEERGFYSHLAVRAAHNTGYSVYGPPTGRRVRYSAATDLLVRNGRVAEMWCVHDGLGLTRQLGLSDDEAVAAVVRHHAATPTLHGAGALGLYGQVPPEPLLRPSLGEGPEALVTWLWHEVWNRRRFDRIAEVYAPGYRFHGPSGLRLRTREAFAAHVLGLLAAFPDAVMRLEHVLSTAAEGAADNAADDGTTRAAVRWRLLGTHDGPGRYGPPTGRRVNVLGVTHHRLRGEQLLGECTVFDELALLAQLHVPKVGETPNATTRPDDLPAEEE